MIGIKVISNTHLSNFEENVEKLLTEHPDAKVIFGAIKGIEGGKGLVVVFSFEKKESPIGEPIIETNTAGGVNFSTEKEKFEYLKAKAAKEAKKTEKRIKQKLELEAKHKAELEAITTEE